MLKQHLADLLTLQVNSLFRFRNSVYLDLKNVAIYSVQLFVRIQMLCHQTLNHQVMQ